MQELTGLDLLEGVAICDGLVLINQVLVVEVIPGISTKTLYIPGGYLMHVKIQETVFFEYSSCRRSFSFNLIRKRIKQPSCISRDIQ